MWRTYRSGMYGHRAWRGHRGPVSRRPYRFTLWPMMMLLMFIGMGFMAGGFRFFWSWSGLILLFFVLPVIVRIIGTIIADWSQSSGHRWATGYEEREKRKNDAYSEAVDAEFIELTEDENEKPKRRPAYAVGDDGELIGIDPDAQEAARSGSSPHEYL